MSLSPRPTAPLAGIDEISLPPNARLKFTYFNNDPLYIHSGATAIRWNYTLNTQSTPTVGGEVVQILSSFVGPLTISGQTAGLKTNASGDLDRDEIPGWKDSNGKKAYGPNHELQAIVAWFRDFMTVAGTDVLGVDPRNRAIRFTYAERGWDFYLMPTKISGFRYDRAVIAPEWSITAEIVSDNALDFFSGVTMSSFTDELLTTNTQLQGQIGLSRFAQTTTETNNPNFGQTGDYGSTNPFLNPDLGMTAQDALKRMGDNFQGLVAAWSQGDFAHFGFGAMLDNNALPKNVDEAFQKIFGNTILGNLTASTGGAGSGGSSSAAGGTYTYSGSNVEDAVAVQIANAFSSKGVPPELGIAVAYKESHLNPDVTQGGCTSSACGIGLFQVNGDGTGEVGSHKAQIIAAGKQRVYSSQNGHIVGIYTTAMQVQDAAEFFKANQPGDIHSSANLSDDQLAEWAYAAERGDGYLTGTSTGVCTAGFAQDLAKARSIMKDFTSGWGVISKKNYAGTDQGVDFSGSGIIPALDSGTVTDVTTSSIIEGGSYPVVVYKLTGGPKKGRYVYIAENFSPAVKIGDKLNQGDVVGHAKGHYPYIEIGFNQTPTGWNPEAPLNPNPHSPKQQGIEMWNYMQNLIGS